MDIEIKSLPQEDLIIGAVRPKVKLCEVCLKNSSKYTCPKCNMSYCTIDCYQNTEKHLNCSEDFYRDQVVNELKSFAGAEVADKKKILEILKRTQENDDDEDACTEDEDDDGLANDFENIDLNDEKTQRKLVELYETELYRWKPWWRNEELSVVQQEYNKKLVFNATKIKINSNVLANRFIFYDLSQIVYVYVALTYIYQLNLEESVEDEALWDEFARNFVKIEESILKKNLQVDLKTRVSLVIVNLVAVNDEDLKDTFNREFLFYLIEDFSSIVKTKLKVYLVISHLFNILKKFCARHKNTGEDETTAIDRPFNAFHLNKEKKKLTATPSTVNQEVKQKEPIKIIRSQAGNKENLDSKSGGQKHNDCLNSAKMLLKRLEFYYQWLNLNENEAIFKESSDLLAKLKLESEHEIEKIKSESEFMKKFLPKLRENINKTKKPLIEEVCNKN